MENIKTNHDNIILKVISTKNGKTNAKKLQKIYKGIYPNILHYINKRYCDAISIEEIIPRMRNHIENRPVCLNCGKPVDFIGYRNILFKTFCSNKCKANYEGTKQKIKETCLKRYGVTSISKLNNIKNKKKETCQIHFGVDCTFQSNLVKEKTKETCKRKYGVDWTSQIEEVKEKVKNTNLKKYGVNCVLQLKENRIKASSKDSIDKKYNTMKRNHTFKYSKPEEELFLYIKEKFPSVKRQYKDKLRYPYNCDFYISELDYFIELQGYYTHNTHPYNPNSLKDQVLVERYKEKYGPNCQAITIWTIKDPEKRECAKRNNLNFKEVWSLKEGKSFIDTIFNKYKHN